MLISPFFKSVIEQLNKYEKNLYYLYASANTIHEFCLSAESEFSNYKNELQKHKLKKINKKLKKITKILYDLVNKERYFTSLYSFFIIILN